MLTVDCARVFRLLVLILGSVGFVSSAAADVGKANSLLHRAEANLSSVAASIGHRTSPPKGSAAKLAGVRLEQALGDINGAKAELEKTATDAAERAEAVERYMKAANEYNRLRAILTGSDAPAPAEDSSDTVRLNYQQEELLSNARFHVREVEGNAQLLTERTGQMKEVQDQLSINFRDVNALNEVVANARRKTGFARDALEQLPENGKGVAEVRQQLVNADAKVSVASDYLRPLHAKLQNLINPANYPEFEADYRRLRELSIMFANPMILQTNRELAAQHFAQADAAKAECIRIAQKYSRLMEQRTGEGERIEGVGNGFLNNHAEFLKASEEQKAALPAQIRENLAQARQYASEAVANQKPLWFTGGIPQVMAEAEDRIVLLEAIDPASGGSLRRELDQTSAELKKQADSLRELIIRQNTMPLDAFAGPDRDKAIKTAISGWRVQQDEFDLLAVRIPSEAWSRETKWTYSNGTWYLSDKSKLQVRLIVADHENPELAIDRPVNVWKDHQKGDSMYATPLFGIDHELQPSDYMLRSKVK